MARPREFDEDAVLEAVCDAFWAKGYEGTSTRDLVQVTGLAQPSLYNAFGDKRALFRRSLEYYLDQTVRKRFARLEASVAPGLAITTFFHEIVERSVIDPERRGCMLINSALESTRDDDEFRQSVVSEIGEIGEFFHRCLLAARQRGEIPRAVSAGDAAKHLLAIMLGVRVLARVNPERALLRGAVSPALALFGLPALPAAARASSASGAAKAARKRL
ncbi:TetR/AcrR family transcriptional regulator [Trinickia mobilis]|uniref:TetR/AcrR family transcriptional regulator n=1 Tax=Trinickia mobilis TaxID=2816356 RepID=UPI001A8D2C9A|nr:TetR/AcrR family transcriptional regulator [Trinickia mobilis]